MIEVQRRKPHGAGVVWLQSLPYSRDYGAVVCSLLSPSFVPLSTSLFLDLPKKFDDVLLTYASTQVVGEIAAVVYRTVGTTAVP